MLNNTKIDATDCACNASIETYCRFLLKKRSLFTKFVSLRKKVMKDMFIRLIGRMLGLLGIAAVGVSCEGMMMAEYGTPYTRFEVNGKLVDKETKEPVSGIVIVYGEEHPDRDEAGNQIVRFYPDGSYVADYSEFWMVGRLYTPENPEKMMLKFSDYDSKESGHYKDTTYVIDLKSIREPSEEENWCMGVYGTDVTFELEREE